MVSGYVSPGSMNIKRTRLGFRMYVAPTLRG